MDQPTKINKTKISDTETMTEIRKDFGDRMGFAIRGIYDEKGFFHLEHYYPYFIGAKITAREDVIINKRIDTDAYTAMCDDIRLGVSLIFYLQNSIDYMERNRNKINNKKHIMSVTLSALSIEGKILLGIEMDAKMFEKRHEETILRNQLIMEAKNGNQEAMDTLAIDEIDLYAMVSRRIRKEDIYSIIESTFIPYGSESDNYSIVGTILSFREIVNSYTGEIVYELFVACNELNYSVCINKIDLQGEPMVGRRFKGNIWMQGYVHFTKA